MPLSGDPIRLLPDSVQRFWSISHEPQTTSPRANHCPGGSGAGERRSGAGRAGDGRPFVAGLTAVVERHAELKL